jgi:hypothetical protein
MEMNHKDENNELHGPVITKTWELGKGVAASFVRLVDRKESPRDRGSGDCSVGDLRDRRSLTRLHFECFCRTGCYMARSDHEDDL